MIDITKWKENLAKDAKIIAEAERLLAAGDALEKVVVEHDKSDRGPFDKERRATDFLDILQSVSRSEELTVFLVALNEYKQEEAKLRAESQA